MRRCEGEVPARMVLGGLVAIAVLVTCGADAPTEWKGECQCGHARAAWLCPEHMALVDKVGCVACLTGPRPHDCTVELAVTRQPGIN